jgi:hypothetical protein
VTPPVSPTTHSQRREQNIVLQYLQCEITSSHVPVDT